MPDSPDTDAAPWTFTIAPTVEAGTAPTSAQMAALAAAFNDRLLSGIGDGARRVAWWWFNLFRQIRNPDDAGNLWPPNGEYFDLYQSLEPDAAVTWPTAEPGDAEGTNLSNYIAGFVHGSPNDTSEAERLNVEFPLDVNGAPPADAAGQWTLAKLQRGAVDLSTGATAWPAGSAAQAYFRVVSSSISPHGKAWGGFLPSPTVLANSCGATSETGLEVSSLAIKFTALRTDADVPAHHGAQTTNGAGCAVVTYAGSCPCWTTDVAAGHVLGIYTGLRTYYVLVSTGGCEYVVDAFPLEDWLEGPYEGMGHLAHTDGGQLRRVLHDFGGMFRGTDSQRDPDRYRIERIAFPWQEFLAQQYALAPARGTQVNDTDIVAHYPTGSFPHEVSLDAGEVCSLNGGAAYRPQDGFCIGGIFCEAHGLQEATAVQVVEDGTVIDSVALTPDEDGYAAGLKYFDGLTGNVAVQLVSACSFASAAQTIDVELAELEERKPEFHDGYLVLRLGSGGAYAAETTTAPDIGTDFMDRGCIIGQTPDDYPQLNTNAVYEAARKFSERCVHIIPRRQFVAYEVTDGKSVLYLKRYAYGMVNSRADLFRNIAPSIDAVASGDLVEGETYVVVATGDGLIRYGGIEYRDGARFMASSTLTFTAQNDAAVYVYDGIRAAAHKRGWTNRWCSFVEWKRYHWSESSIWKPSSYSDYWTWCDRCKFYGGTETATTRRHMNFIEGSGVPPYMISPECMTGFRYSLGTNDYVYDPDPVPFRRSCRVYEPPIELESCIVHSGRGTSSEVLKLTYSSRFHSHQDAPATWSATAPQWNSDGSKPASVTALEAEDYRTDDNAWRSYHVHDANPHWQADVKTGDEGVNSSLSVGAPYGAIYPHLFLVSLLEAPYDDGNDTVQRTDTRMTAEQMEKAELYLRCMCEGFVDARTSTQIICDTGSGNLFDYTFENLCYDAFGGRWIGSVGEALRPENPEGFGPLPNTRLYSDMFNRIAQSVNLLDKARLDIQMTLWVQETRCEGHTELVTPDVGNIKFNVPNYQGTTVTFDPIEDTAVSSQYQTRGNGSGVGADIYIQTDFWYQDFWLDASDSQWLWVLPERARALVRDYNTGFAATHTVTWENGQTLKRVATVGEALMCDTTALNFSGSYWNYDLPESYSECVFVDSGRADARPGGSSTVGFMSSGLTTCAIGPSLSEGYTPIDLDAGTYIKVPLVAYAGT